VLETCQLAGLDVPGDLALLGVDNEEILCENTTPTLSSIQPDFEAGGYEAAHLLEQLMRRTLRTPQTLFYGVKQIVARESSRPSHLSDRRFLKGIEFIRLNSGANIACLISPVTWGCRGRMAEMLFRKFTALDLTRDPPDAPRASQDVSSRNRPAHRPDQRAVRLSDRNARQARLQTLHRPDHAAVPPHAGSVMSAQTDLAGQTHQADR
jgi:hypothetical protein